MPTELTAADAKESLTAHVAARGLEINQKYGPHIGWNELLRILQDRSSVRYPCEILFEARELLTGEFAHPVPSGQRPEDGFIIHVHPLYRAQLDRVPFLVLYQLVLVNYGEFVSTTDAETFGAAALGLDREDYYRALCKLADELSTA